ncbi:DUF484 family protein [Pseudomonas sp. 5Ae-yellow]|jgi:hypothetical protein|uniref:DUF484 family protein n=1 Tax=Pseudomonas sp. 5Ae-yellow TaxID=2759848 RepID=UPI0015F50D9A|nr:DUF484 family protein [Pseudomonas sp. 5Ae-yellow]MBA6420960.1 DUF484 family protein [Pseudomonas sp. 5Ae-yellow]|tara:strand:+ start:3565 stop:4269 length:705 start_codon:yes stop_codon:yes gene_type:complete
MSEQKRQSSDDIDAEQVADYLRRHPAYFAEHDELLTDLIIPHQPGQAVSLVERQVKLLRERNIEVRNRLNQLMDTARENDRLFDKSRRLILSMLEAQSLEQVIASLEDSLRNDFQVPFVCLILFTEADRYSNAHCVSHAAAKEAIGHLLDNGKPVSGALRPEELSFLFGESAEEVASTAFAPISHEGLHGVLALGSKDSQQYRSATGTLFLGYVADALARILLRQRPLADEAHA